MTNCKYCDKKIKKNQEFILEGKWPGYFHSIMPYDWHDRISLYFDCYHKECYPHKKEK